MTTRRQFLTAAVGSTALVGTAAGVPDFLFAACDPEIAKKTDRVLVVIQLSGGNDGINTVIPYADDEYYKNRFTLAVGRGSVLKIDDHCGFHSSMNGFSELLEENKEFRAQIAKMKYQIADYQQAEQTLREYQKAVDGSSDFILTVDRDYSDTL